MNRKRYWSLNGPVVPLQNIDSSHALWEKPCCTGNLYVHNKHCAILWHCRALSWKPVCTIAAGRTSHAPEKRTWQCEKRELCESRNIISIHICMYVSQYICVSMYIFTHGLLSMCGCVSESVSLNMCVCVYRYIWWWGCKEVSMYVCVCTHLSGWWACQSNKLPTVYWSVGISPCAWFILLLILMQGAVG